MHVRAVPKADTASETCRHGTDACASWCGEPRGARAVRTMNSLTRAHKHASPLCWRTGPGDIRTVRQLPAAWSRDLRGRSIHQPLINELCMRDGMPIHSHDQFLCCGGKKTKKVNKYW
jgi:hypothetical protein